MTGSCVWHDLVWRRWVCGWSLICDMLIHVRDMTYAYVWQDSFVRVTWRIHMYDMTHACVWHDLFMHVTWLNLMALHVCLIAYVWDPHRCVWHDSFIWVTWRNHTCYMNHAYVRHDILICATWQFHLCKLTSCHAYECHICHICEMTSEKRPWSPRHLIIFWRASERFGSTLTAFSQKLRPVAMSPRSVCAFPIYTYVCYIHIYIHIYVYIYVYAYIYAYLYIYMCMRVYVCTYIYM